MNLNQIKAELAQHYGSEKIFYQPLTRNFFYTEGAKHYFELAEAWWLHGTGC